MKSGAKSVYVRDSDKDRTPFRRLMHVSTVLRGQQIANGQKRRAANVDDGRTTLSPAKCFSIAGNGEEIVQTPDNVEE